MSHEKIVREILIARGYDTPDKRQAFLDPRYDAYKHDPFLLPDMDKAVERLVRAKQADETVVVYGDYDIDGLTATTLLLEAFAAFGIRASAYLPNRFVEGYGLTVDAVERIVAAGGQLIVTVDCGSLSEKEIVRAGELGVDVIVTDHHNVAPVQPPAVAVINPKRLLQDYPDRYKDYILRSDGELPSAKSPTPSSNSHLPIAPLYPFLDLAGVGVAFKLVQALQTRLEGLAMGQEKWLLDLVALGTVCDVVSLRDENRAYAKWGLEVMRKTRRPGLRALMAVSRVKPGELTARSLGFGLGPRLNASGRLETAQISLDLLQANDSEAAYELAERLDTMNVARRAEQDKISRAAVEKAAEHLDDPVLIVSDPDWSHGIIGIVAAKLLEKYHKPTFVLQELPDGTAKGSARSFGDFSAADGIGATKQHVIKGGGHKFAAGVTLPTESIDVWRRAINEYYRTLKLADQEHHLLAHEDVTVETFEYLDEKLMLEIEKLEPCGKSNPSPVISVAPVTVINRRVMGADGQHVKYTFHDVKGKNLNAISFNGSDTFAYYIGDTVQVWIELTVNEWQGRRTVEGRLLRMESL